MLNPWRKLRARWLEMTDGWSTMQREVVAIGLAVVVLAGIGLAIAYAGIPAWRSWRHERVLAQVREHAERGDYRAMTMALQLAVNLAPADPETWRAAAQYLSMIGSAEAIPARQNLLRLAPGDTSARLELARDALAFGQPSVAETALQGLPDKERREIMFHRLAAVLAARTGRPEDLFFHLGQVVAAVPGDLDARFNYAMSGLASPNPDTHARARAALEALTAEPAFRVRAAIALLTEAARRQDVAQMQELLVFLLGRFAPEVPPDFSGPGMPAWTALIDGLKRQAATEADVQLLARWLAAIGRIADAIAWLELQPAGIAESPAILDLRAELCATADDLDRLERLLEQKAWGEWPAEAQRLAIQARRERLAGADSSARSTWNRLESTGPHSLVAYRAMGRLAATWGDWPAAERAWRAVMELDQVSQQAFGELSRILERQGDLKKLIGLYGTWASRAPEESVVTAQWIVLNCLDGEPSLAVVSRAQELQAALPQAKHAVTALAAVRWRQGRAAEAGSLLARLDGGGVSDPTIAFWRALVSADLGQAEAFRRARRQLEDATLLAEQRRLLEVAQDKVIK